MVGEWEEVGWGVWRRRWKGFIAFYFWERMEGRGSELETVEEAERQEHTYLFQYRREYQYLSHL